jgi:protein-S-isoprenylcysteine O-methyltransferase Ste14
VNPKLEDFIGRASMILVFTVLAALGVWRLLLQFGTSRRDFEWLLNVASNLASLSFVCLVIAMTLVRLPARSVAGGWEARVSALIGTYFLLTLMVLPPTDVGVEWRLVATALLCLGTALSAYCLYWLGRSFSVMAAARKLVVTGPYRLVRHPIYACEAVALIGAVISNISVAAVVVAAISFAFQFRRMAHEERVLKSTFPEYADYAARVPMLVPGLRPRWFRRQA